MRSLLKIALLASICWALLAPVSVYAGNGKGELEIQVIDADTKQPLAVRMILRDPRGKVVRPPAKHPFWNDHFVFDGSISLELAPGIYTFEMEHGPEYKTRSGNFELEKDSEDSKVIDMHRVVNMRKENWYAGDLHLVRNPADIELLMKAEELDFVNNVTWWNQKSWWDKKHPLPEESLAVFPNGRLAQQVCGRADLASSSLLLLNLAKPLELGDAGKQFPGPLAIIAQAREQADWHISARGSTLWDLPLLAATGQLDSIVVASDAFERTIVQPPAAWERPKEGSNTSNPSNLGRWAQEAYFHLLNCGLRIPPAAGSGSGLSTNPAGYNRTYVYCEKFSSEAWWQGLKDGKVVITNGPLLRPLVNGEPPGHVFQASEGSEVELNIALNLATREKIDYLEVIRDGVVVEQIRLDEWAKAGGKLPTVKFERSGWLIIRAVVTSTKTTYRFAMTGPYYVEIGGKPTVSKQSVSLMTEWLTEGAKRVTLTAPEEREAVIAPYRGARKFWLRKAAEINAE